VLPAAQAAYVNSILEKVVSRGTGVRAQLDDRPVAGKTGTTENYGDAWFVGYTPQLAVAVWVGYPTTLKPMLTEFNGEPVSGGTFPALIWKTFAERALEHEGEEPELFASPPVLYSTPKYVARRGTRLLLDNGLCQTRFEVVYFEGMGPQRAANCQPDEVEVPDVRGQRVDAAERRLGEQPLTAEVVYRPAAPLEPAGIVVEQRPRQGYASAFDRVILVVPKAQHGVIPRLVGKDVATARERLAKLQLEPEITWVDGGEDRVLEQTPEPGLAAAPGVTVRLVVARPTP
jgi:membrane peptidoglycan carboxypeptidase